MLNWCSQQPDTSPTFAISHSHLSHIARANANVQSWSYVLVPMWAYAPVQDNTITHAIAMRRKHVLDWSALGHVQASG